MLDSPYYIGEDEIRESHKVPDIRFVYITQFDPRYMKDFNFRSMKVVRPRTLEL